MANPEHLKILKQGVEVWNRWREENPDVRPELRETDLSNTNLSNADLSLAVLFRSNLAGSDLSYSNLRGTLFINSNLAESSLRFANLAGAIFGMYPSVDGADFHRVQLSYTVFAHVDLSKARCLETIQHRGPSDISTRALYSRFP